MKLLSWMHRKSQKDSRSSFNGSATGCSYVYQLGKQTPDNEPHKTPIIHSQGSYHFDTLIAENGEKFNRGESDEIFPGFLTIGTLSLEASTPTFDPLQESAIEDELPEIKYDLKLINEELEKFLTGEAENEEKTEVPKKNGHSNNLTLNDEAKEEGGSGTVKMQLYPLLGYLLGSSTEDTESRAKVEKQKELTHSLTKKSNIVDRNSYKDDEKSQKQAPRNITKSRHFKNNMLQTPQTYPKVSTVSTGCAAVPFSTLAKLKRLLHKKIHPEFGKAVKDPHKISKHENQNTLNQSRGQLSSKSNGIASPMNGKDLHSKADMELAQQDLDFPQKEMTGGIGREHWIKTDAEYFVLELQEDGGI